MARRPVRGGVPVRGGRMVRDTRDSGRTAGGRQQQQVYHSQKDEINAAESLELGLACVGFDQARQNVSERLKKGGSELFMVLVQQLLRRSSMILLNQKTKRGF
ncbi:hypothetical protein IV203_032978 [Nitzschia inconspicua]|uniref:Uncharacterized protein n=1 Tax=Nitzschia inconspicua TaxID=303405 RepID=A0A9K3PFA7_9STRA|nr:hypothetical protein IV203_032978 [Nitzschia inconspicua]